MTIDNLDNLKDVESNDPNSAENKSTEKESNPDIQAAQDAVFEELVQDLQQNAQPIDPELWDNSSLD